MKIKYRCIDCRKEISYGHKRCRSCVGKLRQGILNPAYKTGKWVKINCIDCNKIISPGCKRCKSCENKRRYKNPKNHWNWQGGISTLSILIRNLEKNNYWKKAIYQRDNYTCKNCGQVGGQLEAHHKILFSYLFKVFLKEYNQFSLIEDKETLVRLAMKHKPFWDIDNGQTLCEDCHLKFHNNLNFSKK